MKLKNEAQAEAFRNQLLDTAEALIKEVGLEAFSIRKLTNRLDYSPGIVYHYFKNKEELLGAMTKRGYQEILTLLQNASTSQDPQVRLGDCLRAYILGMCERKELFLILMQSEQEIIRSQVDLLEAGIRQNRASIAQLCNTIEAGIACGEFHCEEIELRAQVIWCATYGLIQRLHKEKVGDEQKQRLIEEHIAMILASLR